MRHVLFLVGVNLKLNWPLNWYLISARLQHKRLRSTNPVVCCQFESPWITGADYKTGICPQSRAPEGCWCRIPHSQLHKSQSHCVSEYLEQISLPVYFMMNSKLKYLFTVKHLSLVWCSLMSFLYLKSSATPSINRQTIKYSSKEKKNSNQTNNQITASILSVRHKASRTSTNFPGSEGIRQVAFLYAIPDASLGLDVFHHYSFM